VCLRVELLWTTSNSPIPPLLTKAAQLSVNDARRGGINHNVGEPLIPDRPANWRILVLTPANSAGVLEEETGPKSGTERLLVFRDVESALSASMVDHLA